MINNKLELLDKLDLLKEGIDYDDYTDNYQINKCNGCCSKKHKCCDKCDKCCVKKQK